MSVELTKEAYLRVVAYQIAWANSADVLFPTEDEARTYLASEADKHVSRLTAYVDAPLKKPVDPFS